MPVFLTVQVVYLREICGIAPGVITNPAVCEIANLKLLGYRQRLINPVIKLGDYQMQ